RWAALGGGGGGGGRPRRGGGVLRGGGGRGIGRGRLGGRRAAWSGAGRPPRVDARRELTGVGSGRYNVPSQARGEDRRMTVNAPRGMPDILPGEIGRWHAAEARVRDFARRFGYREIRTPAVEHTEVFQRAVGSGTDV